MNVDPAEIGKFSALAAQWWDPAGPMAPLHAINPLRLAFIERFDDLAEARALDVGTGGGILAEGLARAGARVAGIDLASDALDAAREHAAGGALNIEYHDVAAEAFAAENPGEFDLVCCMEMLEHVPDPAAIVSACAALTRPGGALYFSTINRNPKAFVQAIIGAEHLLGVVPKGTHEYAKFIKPSELAAWCRAAGLRPGHQAGITYNPLTRRYALLNDVSVNYLLRCEKPL